MPETSHGEHFSMVHPIRPKDGEQTIFPIKKLATFDLSGPNLTFTH